MVDINGVISASAHSFASFLSFTGFKQNKQLRQRTSQKLYFCNGPLKKITPAIYNSGGNLVRDKLFKQTFYVECNGRQNCTGRNRNKPSPYNTACYSPMDRRHTLKHSYTDYTTRYYMRGTYRYTE